MKMIYLLRRHDIISVPFIREAYIICEEDIIPEGYIICEEDIIPEGYIIRDRRERISLKKPHLQLQMRFFLGNNVQV